MFVNFVFNFAVEAVCYFSSCLAAQLIFIFLKLNLLLTSPNLTHKFFTAVVCGHIFAHPFVCNFWVFRALALKHANSALKSVVLSRPIFCISRCLEFKRFGAANLCAFYVFIEPVRHIILTKRVRAALKR